MIQFLFVVAKGLIEVALELHSLFLCLVDFFFELFVHLVGAILILHVHLKLVDLTILFGDGQFLGPDIGLFAGNLLVFLQDHLIEVLVFFPEQLLKLLILLLVLFEIL